MAAVAVDREGTGFGLACAFLTMTCKLGVDAPFRTAATTVSLPEPSIQLCGDWKMTVSSTLKPLPLLSNVCVAPPAVTATVKDEMEVDAGISVENPKKAKLSSKPEAVPLMVVAI